ncbi:calcium-binding protein [Phenylobacterium sp. J367]|uniref:calcium-binding protein n=1 Tax=Phenylobacterium sp. J367 TaxID=2898435 RepID=UPI002150D16D|nr:calcium-binding protein [Phenylobacterium sp. J367]MCR5877468.1 hypothetical protein [Phenylobacterium sp. J367]
MGMGPAGKSVGPLVVRGADGPATALFLDGSGALPGTQVNLDGVSVALVTGTVSLVGGRGKQMVMGDGAAQSMILGEGDDELHGGGGDDTVGSQGGDDRLFGGDGQDRVFGGTGDDYLHGNAGADSVSGDDGHDVLQGGKGDDHLDGGAGDDLLLGDLGDDTLTGGLGADVFVALAAGGRDVVLDFDATQGDRIRLADGVAFEARQEGADTVIDLAGGGRMVLAGVQLSALPEGWLVQ